MKLFAQVLLEALISKNISSQLRSQLRYEHDFVMTARFSNVFFSILLRRANNTYIALFLQIKLSVGLLSTCLPLRLDCTYTYRLFLGPKVVPQEITPASLENLTKMLQRKPVIWDNIHANDYDDRRVFLGPFKGRPLDLYHKTSGLLTNPNCEFQANFVAFESLALWYRKAGGKETGTADVGYNADDVFEEVCEKWIPLLQEEHDFVVKKKSNEDLVVDTELTKSSVNSKGAAKDGGKSVEG